MYLCMYLYKYIDFQGRSVWSPITLVNLLSFVKLFSYLILAISASLLRLIHSLPFYIAYNFKSQGRITQSMKPIYLFQSLVSL